MGSDFGLRGPRTPWVCPNDRQLALRAKLKTGWSIKTSQFNKYPKPQPLSEVEQQRIISVIKKAEELDLNEQRRVGKLVERLESLKRLASGNGVTECILCGDSFGISVFGRSHYKCCDCNKAVCRKCVVELSCKDSVVRLCKICSEYRELMKRSGAWFYKGVPKYILPEKRNNFRCSYESSSSGTTATSLTPTSEEGRCTSRYLNPHVSVSSSNSAPGTVTNSPSPCSKRMGGLWSRSSIRSQSECENDSSGDEFCSKGEGESKFLFHRMETASWKFDQPSSSSSSMEQGQELYQIPDLPNPISPMGFLKQQVPLLQAMNVDDTNGDEGPSFPPSPALSYSSTTQTPQHYYGIIHVNLLYDGAHEALHCTVISAKDLIGMDANGLSDPYCMLKLTPSRFQGGHHRTKTIDKTLNPVFNETITFYGLSHTHMAWQHLQINVIDDDKWARDYLGYVQIPLLRITPQQTRSFSLNLESGKLISNEDKEWGRGSLLLSLSYSTETNTLAIGVLRSQEIKAKVMEPVVKMRLVHESLIKQSLSHPPCSRSGSGHNVRILSPGESSYVGYAKWRIRSPEFQQDFNFKVPFLDLSRLALIVSVWERDTGRDTDYIGGTILGASCKGDRLKHWDNMVKLPNMKHIKWHVLSPTELPSL